MASSVEIARARRRKEAAKAAAREKAFWKKVKNPALITLGVIVVVVAGILLYNTFHLEPNQVAVSGGALKNAESDWVVANYGTSGKPKCFHLATLPQPEGYTLDPDYSVSSDGYVQTLYFKADADDNPVRTIYAIGDDEAPADAIERLKGYTSYFTSIGEATEETVGGLPVTWCCVVSPAYDSDGNTVENRASMTLYSYTPALNNGEVGICLVSQEYDTTDEAKPEEIRAALYSELEAVLQTMTVMK